MKFEDFKRALIGEWRGTKQLYLEPPAPAVSSPSTLFVKPVAGGSFLQFNYDWTYEGVNGVPFTYSDNTTLTRNQNQSVTFVGARYIYSFQ